MDESGDPRLKDPGNPVFVLGACAALGGEINDTIREPWFRVREAITGSRSNPIHMRIHDRRATSRGLKSVVGFFENSNLRRASVAITDRTVFEDDDLPSVPVLEIAFELLLKAFQETLTTVTPIEAVSVIFESGPLALKLKPHWYERMLQRNDGVLLPVAWAMLDKTALEPGLEVADFIAHSTAGFLRANRSVQSKFAARYHSIHPANRQDISRGWELNNAQRLEK